MKIKISLIVLFGSLMIYNIIVLKANVTALENTAMVMSIIANKPVPKPESIVTIQNPYELDKDMEALSSYIQSRNKRIGVEIAERIAWEIYRQSELSGIDVGVICGVIDTESKWNPLARSNLGAKGLMQVLHEDGVEIDQTRIYDIEYNIQKGIEILKSKLDKANGNLNLALYWYVGEKEGYSETVLSWMTEYVSYKTRLVTEETTEENDIEIDKRAS